MATIIELKNNSFNLVETNIALSTLEYVELPINLYNKYLIKDGKGKLRLMDNPQSHGFPVDKEAITPKIMDRSYKNGLGETYYKAIQVKFEGEFKIIVPDIEIVWIENPIRLCKVYKDSNYSIDFSPIKRKNMEGIITLNNGEFLIKSYGKYEPNLTVLAKVPEIEWEKISTSEINLERGKYEIVYGKYFVSKKGTKCFRIQKDGPHMLVREDWGGAFCRNRGNNLPKDGLYFHRASSNGGGTGYDYAILNRGWRNSLTIEDI